MSVVSLVLRSLRFYWRTTLGVFAGAALASGILIGALSVGDTVPTLEQQRSRGSAARSSHSAHRIAFSEKIWQSS
jgi:hypothetical protein